MFEQAESEFSFTVNRAASLAGIGLHSGQECQLTLRPAEAGTGLVFRRVDLEGSPEVLAHISRVVDTSRSTKLAQDSVVVQTTEHLLAAVYALGITDLYMDLDGPELPILDGSSLPFVDLIEKAGICQLADRVPVYALRDSIYWQDGDVQVVALPYDGYKISYALEYSHVSLMKGQFFSVDLNKESFKREVAPCRTFCLFEEVSFLADKGLVRGASLESGVVIWDNLSFAKGGVHHGEEMAGHKALDVIGDLALIGAKLKLHVIAIRSGHTGNAAFSRMVVERLEGRKNS